MFVTNPTLSTITEVYVDSVIRLPREQLTFQRVQSAVDEQLLAVMPEASINPWPCLSR